MTILRKALLMMTMCLLGFCAVPIVSADIGPKPSTTVTVVGLTGDYEFELLIPNRFLNEPAVKTDAEMIERGWNDDPIYRRLNGYLDEDDYISWTLYNYAPTSLYEQDPTPEGWRVFKTGYHMRPPTYKVIILTADELVYVSESVTPAAFYSEVTVDFTGVVGMDATIPASAYEAPGTVAEAIAWGPLVLEFLIRLFATIAIELLILFLFGYRKKHSFVLVSAVNAVSQTLLTAGIMLAGTLDFDALNGMVSIFGNLALPVLLLMGEAFVFAGEMLFYAFRLKEKGQPWPVVYGLVANLVTFLATFVFMYISLYD